MRRNYQIVQRPDVTSQAVIQWQREFQVSSRHSLGKSGASGRLPTFSSLHWRRCHNISNAQTNQDHEAKNIFHDELICQPMHLLMRHFKKVYLIASWKNTRTEK